MLNISSISTSNLLETRFSHKIAKKENEIKTTQETKLMPLRKNHFNGHLISFKKQQKYRPSSDLDLTFKPIIRNIPTGKVIPEYKSGKNYSFVIGNPEKSKPLKNPNANKFRPQDLAILNKPQEIGIRLNYGKNLPWDTSKICRDMIQNFFDANNYRLDGVKIDVKEENGKVKTRISSDSTYSYRHLQSLGATTKQNDECSAGAFGEGSRMILAKLLGNYDAENITYGSSNWEMKFFTDNNGEEAEINSILSKKDTSLDGNFLEFDLPKKKAKILLPELFKSCNYFEHSDNPDFKEFDISNEYFSIKMLPNDESGNFYFIQRYAYGDFGLDKPSKQMHIAIHKIPGGRTFRNDRDRSSLSPADVRNIAQECAKNLSDKEIIETIACLKPIWANVAQRGCRDDTYIGRMFFSGIAEEAYDRDIKFNFKNEYAAKTDNQVLSKEEADFLKELGFKLTIQAASLIGVPYYKDALHELKVKKEEQPTILEKEKLELINKGIDKIVKYCSSVHFDTNTASINLPKSYTVDGSYYRTLKNILKLIPNLPIKPDEEVLKTIQKELTFNSSKKEIEEQAQIINEYIRKNIEAVENPFYIFWNLELSEIYNQQQKNIRPANNIVTSKDLNQPIKIFAPKSTTDPAAEAITTSNGDYNGMWISRLYLENADFYKVLTTALHEITHKYGDDTSATFSYRMTNLLEDIIKTMSEHPKLAQELAELNKEYEKLRNSDIECEHKTDEVTTSPIKSAKQSLFKRLFDERQRNSIYIF